MAATVSDTQKIVVTLDTPDVAIEPGGVAQVVVTMINRQEASDRLFLEVEGVDVEWYVIPVSAVNVGPGEEISERIRFKVARSSENRAGTYPFLVRVQAMETGEVGVAQAALELKPFNSLQVELSHKRAVSTFFRPLNDFDVTVANQGNAEETLDLYASDPDDGCAYEFDTDRISLKPGQSVVVPLAARPKAMPILGGARLFGFTVSARSVEDSYVSANAHGQLETRSLISPLLGIFLLLLAFGGVGWLLTRPPVYMQPKINSFDAYPKTVREGDTVQVSWDVAGDFSQIIVKHHVGENGAILSDPGEQTVHAGSVQVKPEMPYTVYTLVVRPKGKGQTVTQDIRIEVKKQPPLPKPVIAQFYADPDKVHLGEPVMLRWEVKGQRAIILDPGAQHFQFEKSVQVTPDKDTVYELTLTNGPPGAEQEVFKKITVHVVPKDQCLASIDKFAAQPASPYIGDTIRLRWHVSYARAIHIDSDQGGPVGDYTTPTSSAQVKITGPTTVFTLTATDSAGLTKTATVTVAAKARPIPPPTPPGAPAPDAGAATGAAPVTPQ